MPTEVQRETLQARKQELMRQCDELIAPLKEDMELLNKAELDETELARIKVITSLAGEIREQIMPLKAQIHEIAQELKEKKLS